MAKNSGSSKVNVKNFIQYEQVEEEEEEVEVK